MLHKTMKKVITAVHLEVDCRHVAIWFRKQFFIHLTISLQVQDVFIKHNFIPNSITQSCQQIVNYIFGNSDRLTNNFSKREKQNIHLHFHLSVLITYTIVKKTIILLSISASIIVITMTSVRITVNFSQSLHIKSRVRIFLVELKCIIFLHARVHYTHFCILHQLEFLH